MKTTIAILAALTMSGCSGTIGALCYVPADTTGQCSATTVKDPPRAAPLPPAVKL